MADENKQADNDEKFNAAFQEMLKRNGLGHPEEHEKKAREGEFDAAKHEWHVANNTYGFSHALGVLIMGIGILTFLGFYRLRFQEDLFPI